MQRWLDPCRHPVGRRSTSTPGPTKGYVRQRPHRSHGEAPCPATPALTASVTPLLNTTKLAHDQRPYTAFPDGPLTVAFHLDAPASGADAGLPHHRPRRPRGRRRIHRAAAPHPPRRRHPEGLDALAQRLRRLPPVQPDQRLLALHLRRRRRHPRRARGLLRPQPLQLVPGRRRRRRSASRSATSPPATTPSKSPSPAPKPWTDSTFNFWNIAAWIEAN